MRRLALQISQSLIFLISIFGIAEVIYFSILTTPSVSQMPVSYVTLKVVFLSVVADRLVQPSPGSARAMTATYISI